MKVVDGIRYLKIGEVADILERKPQTIKIWYEYAEDEGVDLPPYRTDIDKRGTRYWSEDDVLRLAEFQESIQRGMLSKTTAKKWGKRGKEVKNPYGMKRFENEENARE